MFSRSSGYAIQALTYLAGQPSGKLVGAKEMATSLEIPRPFLWKILRKLRDEKLVRSFKGVRGGYELARPAKNVRISEILAAGKDGDQLGRCVLGLEQCDDRDPCPLHTQWKSLRRRIEGRFQATTLADLARDSKPARQGQARARGVAAKVAC
jgi:Rrf2 family transcriptional regulator, iron-sulfur cluster assembly transcription factor